MSYCAAACRYDSSGESATDKPLGRTSSYTRRETRLATLNRQDTDSTTKDYKKVELKQLSPSSIIHAVHRADLSAVLLLFPSTLHINYDIDAETWVKLLSHMLHAAEVCQTNMRSPGCTCIAFAVGFLPHTMVWLRWPLISSCMAPYRFKCRLLTVLFVLHYLIVLCLCFLYISRWVIMSFPDWFNEYSRCIKFHY